MVLRGFSSRAILSVGFAAILTILGTGVATADSGHGQHGDYIFIDGDVSHTGVTCVYTGPHTKLTSLIVKAPKVWWPNTNSSNERQHGTVGWRAIIQTSPDPANVPWTFAKQSAVQKKIAYEDQTAPYGDSTKAPFTKKSVSWSAPQSPVIYVRVVVVAIWYRHDGTVLGWWKHPVGYYQYTSASQNGTFTNECNNYGLAG